MDVFDQNIKQYVSDHSGPGSAQYEDEDNPISCPYPVSFYKKKWIFNLSQNFQFIQKDHLSMRIL